MKEKTVLNWLKRCKSFSGTYFQIPKKQAKELIEMGMIEEVTHQDGILTIKEHVLTEKAEKSLCLSKAKT